jgi:hypothetical protein
MSRCVESFFNTEDIEALLGGAERRNQAPHTTREPLTAGSSTSVVGA